MRRIGTAVAALVALAAGGVAWLAAAGLAEPADAVDAPVPAAAPDAARVRGAYLARAGNCALCHTAPGEAPYAGGRAIDTPFGRVYASNLTPDAATGLGNWSADDFWRAMHHGKSRDGRLLVPAFPYVQYTRVRRADADAIFAYLRTLAPVARPNRAHALRFPYGSRAALALWRGLYFRAGTYRDDHARDGAWNRGAYLVQGLGHCGACHAPRDALGGSARDSLDGGTLAESGWHAPALGGGAATDTLTGAARLQDLVAYLSHGVSTRRAASGPMAGVVAESLQHLAPEDVQAMATYLLALPAPVRPAHPAPTASAVLDAGARLYDRHCADCHGADGRGAPPAYPPLAGNGALTLPDAANAIRLVLHGGFPPGTAGNPRPFGMPPYRLQLGDAEVAAVVSYVRNAWGNRAGLVSAAEVDRHRALSLP
ncbi:MAG: cytochrome c [Burkholderiales bacterium]|nr:cytochrome c [Burkholderiales bacterium]